MKVLSIFAASVFAAGLALSPAIAAQDSNYGSSGMSSQGAGSQGSQSMGATGSQSQSRQGSMASSDQQQVRQVQQALKEQGYRVGAVDGIMGPKTSSALRNFQRDQGIQTSGQIDQNTLQALGVSGTGDTQEQFGVSPEFEGEQQSDQLEQDQSGAMGGSSDIEGTDSGMSGSGTGGSDMGTTGGDTGTTGGGTGTGTTGGGTSR